MSNNKSVVIRADASPVVGIGHVMRMYALAAAFIASGWTVKLCFKECPPQILRLFSEREIVVAHLNCPKEATTEEEVAFLVEFCRLHDAELIILDGYQFTFEYQSRLSQSGLKLMVMDDFKHSDKYCCDFLINQNFGAENLEYDCTLANTKLLLGNQYTLIRPEIMVYKEHPLSIDKTAFKILLSLGGADYDNASSLILNAISMASSMLTKLEAKVVVTTIAGSANPHKDALKEQIDKLNQSEQIEFILLTEVIDLGSHIAATDLLISAGGGTVWEAACLATANMVVITASNQTGVARFAEAGAIFNIGDIGLLSEETIAQALVHFLFSRDFRKMPALASQLVDGLGASRVVKAVESI